MSTTPQVVVSYPALGHFSDTPLLILACLENGPKHGHSMLRMGNPVVAAMERR